MTTNFCLAGSTRLILIASMSYAALEALMPSVATAQSAVQLEAVVRDFSASHPDFGISALSTTGHYAGTVDLGLVNGERPGFVSNGFEVVTEWTERGGNPISHHMYRDSSATVFRLIEPPQIDKDVTIDSWDPSVGPYPLGVGPAPRLEVHSVLPRPSVPPLGASVGDVVLGSGVLSVNLHCDNLNIKKNSVVTVSGNVTVVCEGTFWMDQASSIELAPGSTLALYINGSPSAINQGSQINMNTMDPSRCYIVYLGTEDFDIKRDSAICGTLIAPDATVHLHFNDHFYGSLLAHSAIFNAWTGLHHVGNASVQQDHCGADLIDTAGLPGILGDGGVTSALTFDEWFSNVLGVNQSFVHTLTLTDDGTGIYEYLDDDFHPIDNLLLGNEGQAHNENFTLVLRADFVYQACSGQFIQAAGGDGLWVFIDETLVIDLGGMDYLTDQYIDLDRVGSLVDGEVHEMQMFFASRTASNPTFNFRTNVLLNSEGIPFNVSMAAD